MFLLFLSNAGSLPSLGLRGFLIGLWVLLLASSGAPLETGAPRLVARDAAPDLRPNPVAARLLHASILPPLHSSRGQQLSAVRLAAAGSRQEASPGPLPVFEFHSGFWINLHHFLYQQGRIRKVTPWPEPSASSPPVSTAGLSQEEQQAWAAALDYYAYAGDLSDRNLLFNGDMVNLNNRLAELETCADLSGRNSRECASGLRQELIAALERAAPVYRARWWPEHDRANRSWIASVGPMVRQFGGGLARQLSATYRADWPTGRLRVDVVFYGGPYGAYTSLDPVHLTISSRDERNQGFAALEVLFHEASHALAGAVRDAIVRECRARGKPIPRDLWHALLFYTTGEIVKRALSAPDASGRHAGTESAEAAARGSAGPYTPYAYRYGLYARGWNNYQRGLNAIGNPTWTAKSNLTPPWPAWCPHSN
jgi:hypothetical protein